jgi:large subunit ribosomal protein L29
MKMTELRAMDEGEAARRLRDLQEEMFNLRFQFATRRLTNTTRIREVRRDIARLLTRQRELELLAARG